MKFSIEYIKNRVYSITYYQEPTFTSRGYTPHREDGPAYINSLGDKYYYVKGYLHREDGPAIDNHDGSKYWFWEGREITEETCKTRKADKDNWFGC